jgi:enoyl-CoA hydratase/carnithine racemase
MGYPEVNVGVTAADGGSFLAPRSLGLSKAREPTCTAELILAEESSRL